MEKAYEKMKELMNTDMDDVIMYLIEKGFYLDFTPEGILIYDRQK